MFWNNVRSSGEDVEFAFAALFKGYPSTSTFYECLLIVGLFLSHSG